MGWLSPQVVAYLPLYQESPTPGPWYRLLGAGPRSRRWGVGQQWSFIHCSPSLPITCVTTWTIPCPVCGKLVFPETSPWCQELWGLLLYITVSLQSCQLMYLGTVPTISTDIRSTVRQWSCCKQGSYDAESLCRSLENFQFPLQYSFLE